MVFIQDVFSLHVKCWPHVCFNFLPRMSARIMKSSFIIAVTNHNLPEVSFRALLSLLMSFFFLACLVVRDLCTSGCRQNYYLTPPSIFFPTHNSFFNTSDSYQFEIRGRLRLVSVMFSSLVLYIGHLEKSFPESIM